HFKAHLWKIPTSPCSFWAFALRRSGEAGDPERRAALDVDASDLEVRRKGRSLVRHLRDGGSGRLWRMALQLESNLHVPQARAVADGASTGGACTLGFGWSQ